jgi:phosphate transport system substrate-binding protein
VLGNAPFRDTLKEAVGSASLIIAVGQDPLGIGYSGIGYQSSVVRVVPLAPSKTEAYVAPSAETTTDGTYPLTRMLYLYINHKPSDALSPTLAEFLRFVNSREGQEIVMRSGVYRLPQREIERNLSRLSGERVAYKNDH